MDIMTGISLSSISIATKVLIDWSVRFSSRRRKYGVTGVDEGGIVISGSWNIDFISVFENL